jgi:hypothetical protein
MPRYNGGFIGTDGLDAPDPPTAVTPTAGDAQLSIAFTAPTDTGTSAITGFVAQVASSGDNYSAGSNTGSSSPIVVSSLSNGTSYTAKVWAINAYGTSAPSDASAAVSPVLARGIFAGGGGGLNNIEYLSFAATGTTSDFGDLTNNRTQMANGVISSQTRGLFVAGGVASGSARTTDIDYITIASTGNATDFGDASQATKQQGGASNSITGIAAGGNAGSQESRGEYITIATTGNAVNTNGLTAARDQLAGCSNGTRAIFAGGNTGSNVNIIDFLLFASSGDGTDFGDLTSARETLGGASNSTRGLFAGGNNSNIIDYITMASTGNATDFGDLTISGYGTTGTASSTIALFGGSSNSPSTRIDSVTIASTGNATDYGDLGFDGYYSGACSSVHGGL